MNWKQQQVQSRVAQVSQQLAVSTRLTANVPAWHGIHLVACVLAPFISMHSSRWTPCCVPPTPELRYLIATSCPALKCRSNGSMGNSSTQCQRSVRAGRTAACPPP